MPPKKTHPPSLFNFLLESRTVLEFASYFPALPFLQTLPQGDGHPVMVFPGFLTSDLSTVPLRHFLKSLGYAVHGWGFGSNTGYRPALNLLMQERILAIHAEHGKKLSLIGWSLGGVYAREMARELPDHVRQVITMGSPIARAKDGSNMSWLYNLINGDRDGVDDAFLEKIMEPPPVPATAIFTRSDGVVTWRSTIEQREGPITQNVEVMGSHCGLGHNPLALYVIADRLSQPENGWQRFSCEGWTDLLYQTSASERPQPQESAWTEHIRAMDQALAALGNTPD